MTIAVVTFYSCDEEQVIDDPVNITSSEHGCYVNEGVLCFKNEESIEDLSQELAGLDYSELAAWEQNIGFVSIERASSEIMEKVVCRAEGFVASGMAKDEVLQKFDSGEIEELIPEVENEIAELNLDYKIDDNGLRYIDYKFNLPFNCRFLNKNYTVVVADTLYKYFEDRIELYPNCNSEKDMGSINPIIAYKSIDLEKSIPVTYNEKLCFDADRDDDHRLECKLYAERYIFQKVGCASNCVHTRAKLYLWYQGYYHGWFNWKKGNYSITYNGAFTVEFNRQDSVYEQRIEIEGTENEFNSSPGILYRIPNDVNGLDSEPSSYYSEIGFGDIDCFVMTLNSNVECYFNQANGLYGADYEHGYKPIYYLYDIY